MAYRQALQAMLPYGMLATRKWLKAQGLSTYSIDNAVKAKALFPLTSGVYSQYTRSISWEGVVASIQKMELNGSDAAPSTLAGGLTALHLSGLSQYLSLGSRSRVHLYSNEPLPTWLKRLSLPIDFEGNSSVSLWSEDVLRDQAFVRLHQWTPGLPPIQFSCPERAILEVLTGVPKSLSFEHADELMQGLINLSPRKLDRLLMGCKSVKVKRLFLWLANRQGYKWFEKLNLQDYELGSGKRSIAMPGKLDSAFLITVPKNMSDR